MTRAEAMALVMLRLGKRTGLDTDVVLELKQAQNDLETGELLPWFLRKALSGLATVASTKTVSLPSDFIRETEEKWWLTTTDGVKRLYKGEYDELYERELFDSDYLDSNYYALVGGSIYIFPTPASAMAIAGFYFAGDVELSAAETENNWLKYASGALIGKAGMRMAKTLRDETAYKIFSEDYNEAMGRLLRAEIARQQAAMNAVMGG